MYIVENFIDFALNKSEQEWVTEDHRIIAKKVLLGNPEIKDMDVLVDGCKIINEIPKGRIREITVKDLRKLGVQI